MLSAHERAGRSLGIKAELPLTIVALDWATPF
jgi:hypothetical protein